MLYEYTQIGLADSPASDIFDDFVSMASGLTSAMDSAKSVLTALSTFLVANAEPSAVAAQAIIDEIDNIREDLFESGVKLKVISPFIHGQNPRTRVKHTTLGQATVDNAQKPSDLANWTDQQIVTILNSKLVPYLSFDQANRILISSITNPGPNAPTYSSTIDCLNLAMVSPSPSQLLPLMEAFSAIFKFPEIERIKRKISTILSKQGVYLYWDKPREGEIAYNVYKEGERIAALPSTTDSYHESAVFSAMSKSDYDVKVVYFDANGEVEVSIPFDFKQLKDEDVRKGPEAWVDLITPVKMIPGAAEANNLCKQILYDLGVYAKAAEGGISAAVRAVERKIARIEEFSSRYTRFLELISNAENTGFYVGSHSGSNGVNGLVQDMADSSGVPDGMNFCVLVSFVGGTASLDGLKTLLGIT